MAQTASMPTLTRSTVLLAACVGAALPAVASAFSLEEVPGRLPKNVVPVAYSIAITPDVPKLALARRESVLLHVRSATATIQFNAVNERLHDVRWDGKPVKRVVGNDQEQITTVTLGAPAAPGSHTLTFSYSGKIETQPHGLFAQHYAGPDGAKGLLLSKSSTIRNRQQVFAIQAHEMAHQWTTSG